MCVCKFLLLFIQFELFWKFYRICLHSQYKLLTSSTDPFFLRRNKNGKSISLCFFFEYFPFSFTSFREIFFLHWNFMKWCFCCQSVCCGWIKLGDDSLVVGMEKSVVNGILCIKSVKIFSDVKDGFDLIVVWGEILLKWIKLLKWN